MSKVMLELMDELKRVNTLWNKVINLIKEIHFERYSQREIGIIVDEIVVAVWSAESEKIKKELNEKTRHREQVKN